MTTYSLDIPESELRLNLCLGIGQVFRWRKLDSGVWLGADGPNWFAIEKQSSGDDQVLQISTNADREAFIRHFGLEEPLDSVRKRVLEKAPALRDHSAVMSGLRLMSSCDPVECLFCFLCSSNNHLKRITLMTEWLAGLGPPFETGFGPLNRFPGLDVLARLEEQDLRKHGFGYRGGTIPLAARQIVSLGGETWLHSLSQLPYEHAIAQLQTLAGVGPKIADCVALYGLGFSEAAPFDTHLWQSVRRHLFQNAPERVSPAQYRVYGAKFRQIFGKDAGHAHQLLYAENLLNWRLRRKQVQSAT
ncbi:MAG: hypothetical protein JST40_09175 [Armatimonadetes bacterium]|nr:hypothetical protein [Armatimonadota bacterium]